MRLLRHRLLNQRLAGPGFRRPEQVVSWLCGVQSQDYLGAKWSVGQRVAGGTDAMVEAAFDRGHILRTHVLRPTWHFVAPADIRWMLAVTAPHIHKLNAYQARKVGLDQQLFRRAEAVLAQALAGNTWRTRDELRERLHSEGIHADGQRLAYLMMHAELVGLVVSGPMRGKQHTYALLDERAPATRPLARDEALGTLAHRFFTGHGPATLRHFAWWSGLTLRDAAAGLALVRSRLNHARVDDKDWFGLPDALPRARLDGAWLIPEYDEALIGSRELGVTDLPGTRKGKWADTFYRPILVGAQWAGTWRRTVAPRSVLIETNLRVALTPPQSARVERAAARYGTFLGLPVVLRPLTTLS